MRANIPLLEKKAIKLALKEKWEDVVKINNQILEEDPKNIKAKIILGRAYLQTRRFKEAQNLFKEVLKQDPINKVALKNFDLAKKRKARNSPFVKNNGTSLIKEPGTTVEVKTKIIASGVSANIFSYGQEFRVKILNTKAKVIYNGKALCEIDDKSVVKSLNIAKRKGTEILCVFIKGELKNVSMLLISSTPVFKGDKQEIKPYMKKGSIDEPKIEIESFDD